jgi:periplasmic divalent cation tolerance protein
MKTTARCVMVLVTAPNTKTARLLARSVVESGLAACVNIVPRVESHYRWQGRLEQSQESLLLIKTTRRRVRELEARVLSEHPYDTPEFVVMPLAAGNGRYLDWLEASVAAVPGAGEKT